VCMAGRPPFRSFSGDLGMSSLPPNWTSSRAFGLKRYSIASDRSLLVISQLGIATWKDGSYKCDGIRSTAGCGARLRSEAAAATPGRVALTLYRARCPRRGRPSRALRATLRSTSMIATATYPGVRCCSTARLCPPRVTHRGSPAARRALSRWRGTAWCCAGG
jgi:hypothetical protein